MNFFTLALVAAISLDGAIAGKDLALKSSGSAVFSSWLLNANGFVGTYVQLDQPGDVTVSVNARARNAARMNVVVVDSKAEFELTPDAKAYQHTFTLPAGCWFVRVEYPNHSDASSVEIGELAVTGATVKNEQTDANALAAADSYIANFRRGRATVRLPSSVASGTKVRANLKRHEFMFGEAVSGFEKNELMSDNPPAGSDAARYQEALTKHFQAIVPGNAGKWAYNEAKRDVVTMDYVDTQRAWAKAHDMKMRMHALLWNTGQQPKWVIDLVDAAARGDEKAKADLRRAISRRIGYYVRDRATSYTELDILNEALHQSKYWEIFGAEGIADIFREAEQAVADAGANTRLYVNEYNVLQYSSRPSQKNAAPDPYANWYREHVEQIRAAGGSVGGIGVQYYAFTEPDIRSPHSAARIFGVFQNLSVTGLPFLLSEFGVKTKSDPNRVPDILEDTLRITFGSPNATGFFVWGFWRPQTWDQARGAAFYDEKWNPTGACKRWEEVMARWTTDEMLTVAADGTIAFTGYFGDYELSAGDKTFPLKLVKGTTQYTVAAP